MKSMTEKLLFWMQPEYHYYHVGAVVATLSEAVSYIAELEAKLKAALDKCAVVQPFQTFHSVDDLMRDLNDDD
jgi:hypothetical protein